MANNTRRNLAGGAVIGVAALAFYLGTQWPGFGPGGTGTGFGTTSSGTGEQVAPPTPDLVGDEAVSVTSEGAGVDAPEILNVVMSARDYYISTTPDFTKATEADLSEVAHAAMTATGDQQGIRVRIYRKKDATAGVFDDLKRKLDQVGIPSQSVQFMDTPVE